MRSISAHLRFLTDREAAASADVEEFHQKVERGVGRNHRGCSSAAVAEVAWDHQFDHAPFAHQLHALGPARDHLVEAEVDRLAPLVGTIEDLPAVEPAVVVNLDVVGRPGIGTGALAKDSVLQAGGGAGERRGGVPADA